MNEPATVLVTVITLALAVIAAGGIVGWITVLLRPDRRIDTGDPRDSVELERRHSLARALAGHAAPARPPLRLVVDRHTRRTS